MYPDNSWYSHRYILNEFCNNKDKMIISSIQHGFLTLSLSGNFGKLKFPYSKFLVWNKIVGNYLAKKKLNNFEIIGAPFLYLHKMSKKIKVLKDSYLVFLPHSTPGTKAPHDNYNFAKYLKNKFKGKITICVFYKDLNSDLKKNYEKFNFKVVSCGTRYDKKYLFKLYTHLSSSQNIIITELGTPLFYSLFLKKKTFFIQNYNFKNPLKGYGGASYLKNLKEYKKKNSFLFKDLPKNKIVNKIKGKLLADQELGYKYVKSAKSLKKFLYPKNKYTYAYSLFFSFYAKIKWFILENKLYIQDKISK